MTIEGVLMFETLEWIGGVDGYLEMIDQRKLPNEFVKLQCKTVEQVWEAIKTLAVRGAPVIGIAAGYGICVAMQQVSSEEDIAVALRHLKKSADYLASSRPTAVNLFWALERMNRAAIEFIKDNDKADVQALCKRLLDEADAICDEDKRMCGQIGINGEKFIKDGGCVLTHCNAGALATGGTGTALAPIYEANRKGKKFTVYADETRPLLQGARLTAWELMQSQVDVVLICDNLAGVLMKQGKVDAIIVGADRIAANGDTANKIGTFSLSILAKEHKIPFYVAAPSSTFDLSIASGDQIPIEERSGSEVVSFGEAAVGPEGVRVYNPAFDVTEARNITAIITEKGVIEKPDTEIIAKYIS